MSVNRRVFFGLKGLFLTPNQMKKLLVSAGLVVVGRGVLAQNNSTTETAGGLGIAQVLSPNRKIPAFYRPLRRPGGLFIRDLGSQSVVGKFAHIQGI
jgi:hypothetical protein